MINRSAADRERLIDVEWQQNAQGEENEKYVADINIFADNRHGLLADISKALTEKNINILSMNTRINKQGIVTLSTSFEISGREELNRIMERIRNVESVIDIERTTG